MPSLMCTVHISFIIVLLQNIGRKMTLSEFIENLAELNDGGNFPSEVLSQLFYAIKEEKLQYE